MGPKPAVRHSALRQNLSPSRGLAQLFDPTSLTTAGHIEERANRQRRFASGHFHLIVIDAAQAGSIAGILPFSLVSTIC